MPHYRYSSRSAPFLGLGSFLGTERDAGCLDGFYQSPHSLPLFLHHGTGLYSMKSFDDRDRLGSDSLKKPTRPLRDDLFRGVCLTRSSIDL